MIQVVMTGGREPIDETMMLLAYNEYAPNGCGILWPLDLTRAEDVVEEPEIYACLAEGILDFIYGGAY